MPLCLARALLILNILLLCVMPVDVHAESPLSEEHQRLITTEIETIRALVERQPDAEAKYRVIERSLTDASRVEVRLAVLNMAEQIVGDGLEPVLLKATALYHGRVRLAAVQLLARHGSPVAIDRLLELVAAEPEPDPDHRLPSRTLSQRAACFALADLGLRHEHVKQRIIDGLTVAKVASDELHDLKTQSLYILTRDRRLLTPFFDRLASDDTEERQRGVTAFRFLQLTKAPPELVARLNDESGMVRSWTVLTLGEIGDPATIDRLIGIATDQAENRNVRINAITALGNMRAEKAERSIRNMLEDETVNINAAIALSKITGKRHPLVPEGYALNFEE